MPEVFAVPVFFIVFRETLETTIVVSVLLSFLKQQLGPDRDRTVYKKLRNQVNCRCPPSTSSVTYLLLSCRSGTASSSAS
jgi:high-affinity Fe2+/Pb2+ permease